MNVNRIISETYRQEEANSKHYVLHHSTYIKYKGKASAERQELHGPLSWLQCRSKMNSKGEGREWRNCLVGKPGSKIRL